MTPDLQPWLRRTLLLLYPLLLLIPAAHILGETPIFGDDHSSHLVVVHHLVSLIRLGETDLFCPTFNLGFPMYLYYQPLPHVVPALLHLLSFGLLTVTAAFNLSVVVLFCGYPLAVYKGARWLGLGDSGALAAGALAPLVSSSLGFGLTVHSVMGSGLYTQTWAMALLPLCLGLIWRHISTGKGGHGAAGLLILVFLSHAFYGVVAATAGVIMLLVRPGKLRETAPRLAIAGLASMASLLFWLVPLLVTRDHMGGWPWGGEERWQGYGAARVAGELLSGSLLDQGRLPLLSLMLAGGVVWAAWRWRKEPAARVLLCCFALFCLFLMGRKTFGHLVDIQPANLGLQLFRYLGAVHLFGVLLAGLGMARLISLAGRRFSPMVPLLLAAALLASPLLWLGHTANALFKTMDSYSIKERDLRDLAAAIRRARDGGAGLGRIYAHTKTGQGSHLVSALLGRYTSLPMGQSYGVGMHDSLGFYYLEYLNPSDAKRMALYNFRYVVARPDSKFAQDKEPVFRRGNELALYVLSGRYGYFTPLARPARLVGLPRKERARARRILPREGGGVVLSEETAPNRFAARVRMDRPGVLALKVAHHPFWHAIVDGRPSPLLRVAPALLAVEVGQGEHGVQFRFRNPWWQKALLLLALLGWAAVGFRKVRGRL